MIHADFARSLSLLRQEKGISQRQAAGALGISQALLSHYENGVREPGLAFVVKACDFYNVSADFLLGRTLSRDGTTILDVDTLFDASAQPDNLLKGSVMATLSKKLVVNSVGVLFDLLGKLDNKKAIRAATNFLSTSVYILFRHLRRAGMDNGDSQRGGLPGGPDPEQGQAQIPRHVPRPDDGQLSGHLSVPAANHPRLWRTAQRRHEEPPRSGKIIRFVSTAHGGGLSSQGGAIPI